MKQLKQLYSGLSSDSKATFWILATNLFVVIFTFIFGLFVQYMVASKNNQLNEKLLNYSLVDTILPIYDELMEKNNFIYQYGSLLLNKDNDQQSNFILANKHIQANIDDILNNIECSMQCMLKAQYYFNDRDLKQFRENNSKILLGLYVFKAMNKPNITKAVLKEDIEHYFLSHYFLSFTGGIQIQRNLFNELVDVIIEGKENLNGNYYDQSIVIQYFISPMINNIQLFEKELRFANQSQFGILDIINDYGNTLLIFIFFISIAIIVWLKACNKLASRITQMKSKLEKDNVLLKAENYKLSRINKELKSKLENYDSSI